MVSESRRKASRKHANTPRGKYTQQKAHAKARGVEFRMTYDEWWGLWEASGKYHLRGKSLGRYCMSRKGDTGAYEVGNVEITLVKDNMEAQIRNGAHVSHKLTKKDLLEIQAMDAQGFSQPVIAKKFGVGQPHISRLLSGLRGVVLTGLN